MSRITTSVSSVPSVPVQFNGNTGFAIPVANVLNVVGSNTQGINTVGSGNTLTISGINASTSQKGVASFSATYFTVTAGVVSLTGPFAPSTFTAHGVLIGEGTNPIVATSAGTALQVLQSGGASADPNWSSFTILASFAQGDIIYANAANTLIGLTKSTTATRYISNTGTTNNPAWAQVDLSNGVTSTLQIANGGTGFGGSPVGGGIFYSGSVVGGISVAPTAVNQVLLSQNAGGGQFAPIWSTATYPVSTTINQILYSSAANTIAGITTGNNGVLITGGTGIPSISSTLPNVVQDNITRLGTIASITTPLGPAFGGTGIVNNAANTLTWSGAFAATFTLTGITSVTFPTSGTLATTTSTVASITGTANQIAASSPTGAVTLSLIGPYTPATYSAHGVLVGEGTSSIVAVGPNASTGIPLISQGASSDPIFGTAAVIGGGTGVTSVTIAPTATAFSGWDANSNLSSNSFIAGYATIATAAGNTILTVASKQQQFFTGTNTQTVTLPVVSTLVLGQLFTIVNNSTMTVTIVSSGGNTVLALGASTSTNIVCIKVTGTDQTSWSASGVSGVASITGTANQINVSSSTGAVTLSAPQDIATSSNVQFGTLALGAALTSGSVFTSTSTASYNFFLSGTQTAQTTGTTAGIFIGSTIAPASTLAAANGIANLKSFNPSTANITAAYGYYQRLTKSGGSGTIADMYGIYLDGGSSTGASAVSNKTNLRVVVPAIGTTKYTAYFDTGVGIGASNAVATDASALLVSTSNAVILQLSGNQTALIGSTDQYTIRMIPTFAPTSGATNVQVLRSVPSISPPAGQTITNVSNYYSFPITGSTGTISTFYGMYLQSGSSGGATVTTSYGQVTEIPAFGSTKYTAYFQATAGTSGVCIGGLSTTYQLYVATDSAGKPGVGGLWTVVSDERVKKNIVDCDDALSKLSELRIREFEYNDDVCEHINVCKGSKHYGFLAHEYEEVFPEDVVCGNEKFGNLEIEGCKAINTGQTSALVIRAIQQLEERIKVLEAERGN